MPCFKSRPIILYKKYKIRRKKNTVGDDGVMVCVGLPAHTSLTYKDYNKPGISRDKTMADKLIYITIMMIHKMFPSIYYNWWLKSLVF